MITLYSKNYESGIQKPEIWETFHFEEPVFSMEERLSKLQKRKYKPKQMMSDCQSDNFSMNFFVQMKTN